MVIVFRWEEGNKPDLNVFILTKSNICSYTPYAKKKRTIKERNEEKKFAICAFTQRIRCPKTH